MTDDQFLAWAAGTAPDTLTRRTRRVVLVEAVASVSGVDTTRYLSAGGYTSGPADTPANQHYTDCITDGVEVTETLPLDGAASIAYADIEIRNDDGSRDAWLDDIWAGRAVNVYVGDASWPRADFRLVFAGIADDLAARTASTLNIVLRDKAQRLNTALSTATLGGTTANAERLNPLCFGEVHNITPLLVDPATLEYQVHNGAIEDIIEVRDNGVPVSITKYLSTGKFRLAASPVGQITASVQGDKTGGTYRNTAGALIQHIAKTHGTQPLSSGDIDSAAFATFEAAHTQPLGLYVADRANVLAICQQLAAAVGAQVAFGATGLLVPRKVDLPAAGTPAQVTASDMIQHSLRLSTRPPIAAAVRIGYCKNHTVQATLPSGILPEHADLFAQEWLTVTASDSATATAYKLPEAPPEQTDTALLTTATAQAEADRRLALWSTRRRVLAYEGAPSTLLHAVASAQTITHSRFGLSGGVTGQVIRRAVNWMTLRTQTEVLL